MKGPRANLLISASGNGRCDSWGAECGLKTDFMISDVAANFHLKFVLSSRSLLSEKYEEEVVNDRPQVFVPFDNNPQKLLINKVSDSDYLLILN